MNDIFGQDIKLGSDSQALVAADGSMLLTEGPETGVQDIMLRLFTPLGGLFYDITFGSLVHEWVHEENTEANRMAFEAEVCRRLRSDPRVKLGSESCAISDWNERGITAVAEWQFIDDDHRYNLVIEYNSDKTEMVIKDVSAG